MKSTFLMFMRLCILVFTILMAQVSWAGHWELDKYVIEQTFSDYHWEQIDPYPPYKYFLRNDIMVVSTGQKPVHTVVESPTSPYFIQSALDINATGQMQIPPSPQLSARLIITPHYKWVGSEDELPTSSFYIRERGSIRLNEQASGFYSVLNPYNGQFSTPVVAKNGFEDGLPQKYNQSGYYGYGQWCEQSDGRWHVDRINAKNGATTARGKTRTLELNVDVTVPGDEAGHMASLWLEYEAQLCQFSLDATPLNIAGDPLSPYTINVIENTPTKKNMSVWLRQNYRENSEDPLGPPIPFWEGKADFNVTARVGIDYIFPDQKYVWNVTPDVYVPTLDPPRQVPQGYRDEFGVLHPAAPEDPENPMDERVRTLTPQPSTEQKNFHWDFGSTAEGFPKTTKTTVMATGTDPGSSIVGPAVSKIHWYLPEWFVTRPKPVQTIDPDYNPNSNDYVNMQTIRFYEQQRRQFIVTGAILVRTALQAEVAVIETLALGPVQNLATAKILELGTDTAQAIKGIREARSLLKTAAEFADEADNLIAQPASKFKNADEIAAIKKMAEDFRIGDEVKDAQKLLDKEDDLWAAFETICTERAARDPRYRALGTDITGNQGFRWQEAEAAIRLEGQLGRQLQRATQNGDLIDVANNRVYDFVSCPPKYFDQQWLNITSQIEQHIYKLGNNGRTVIDTAYWTEEQTKRVKEFVAGLEAGRNTIIFLY